MFPPLWSDPMTAELGDLAHTARMDLHPDKRISTNTARTHLSRIYDKTCVNSQPALVRLLLSVG